MAESSSEIIIHFLLQIGLMLAVGLIFGQVMRLIHQPAVLGELLGGIILGPTILGTLFPKLYNQLFPGVAEMVEAREVVIRIGMLFFMFVAGLEVNLGQIGRQKKSIFLVSVLGCLLPFGLGAGSIYLFPNIWNRGLLKPEGDFVFFIGIALSISALPVITRILMDLKLMNREFGGIAITSAAINDLLGWSLFALLLNNFNASGDKTNPIQTIGTIILVGAALLIFGRVVGQFLFAKARKSLPWPSGFLGMSAVFIFLAAAITEIMHIHAIFGAFLIGVALIPVFQKNRADQAREIIYQFAVSFFAPLYFVSVGLKADFAANFDVGLVLLVIALAAIGKIGGAAIGARISGIDLTNSLAIGYVMNARGAMEMILASVALELGLIDQRIFVALVIMALVTSMMSGPLLQWLFKFKFSAESEANSFNPPPKA